MVRRFTAIVMLAACLAVAAAPQLKEKRDDNQVVGHWAVTKAFNQGTEDTETYSETEYTFYPDGKWGGRHPGPDLAYPGRFTSDRIYHATLGPNRVGGNYLQGIYKVEGDELIVAWGSLEQAPATFDASNKNATVLFFKRVKD